MRFTFIHAADLHLGSPFIGLASNDEELAKRVATASREALEALVDYAILQKVAFVLIAGDVYDVDWRDMTIGHFFNREMSRLHREDIPVFLIKGNHDAESVITKNLPLPANVKSYSATEAHTEEISSLRVAIHGRSLLTVPSPKILRKAIRCRNPLVQHRGPAHLVHGASRPRELRPMLR